MSHPFIAAFRAGREYDPVTDGQVSSFWRRSQGYMLPEDIPDSHPLPSPVGVTNMLTVDPADWTFIDVTHIGSNIFSVDTTGVVAQANSAPCWFYAGKVPYTVEVDVKNLTSGSRTFRLQVQECSTASGSLSTIHESTAVVAAGASATLTLTFTPVGMPFGRVRLRFNNTDNWAATNSFMAFNARMDAGSSLNGFFRFDDGTPNEDWPRIYFGTPAAGGAGGNVSSYAHSGIMGIRALPEAFQYVPNPYCSNDIVGYSAVNGTLLWVADLNPFGDGMGRLTATAANATMRASLTITNGQSVTFVAYVFNNTANARNLRLSKSPSTADVSIPAFSWASTSLTITGTGVAANFDLIITDSLNTEQFYVWYFGVVYSDNYLNTAITPDLSRVNDTIDASTSSWTGVAHASTSTRVALDMEIDLHTEDEGLEPIVDYSQGTIAIKISHPLISMTGTLGVGDRVLLALDDKMYLGLGDGNPNVLQFVQDFGISGVESIGSAAGSLTNRELVAIFEWVGSSYALEGHDLTADTAIARVEGTLVNTPHSGSADTVHVGSKAGGLKSAACWIHGVLFSRRILSSEEKTMLYDSIIFDEHATHDAGLSKMSVKRISTDRIIARAIDRGHLDG